MVAGVSCNQHTEMEPSHTGIGRKKKGGRVKIDKILDNIFKAKVLLNEIADEVIKIKAKEAKQVEVK